MNDISKGINVNNINYFKWMEDIPMEEKSPLQAPPKEHHISLHALSGSLMPQTLKLIGYIKHIKVIVLIESGSTHHFIHRRVAQDTHCYVHPIYDFQIMIANGRMMECGDRCENTNRRVSSQNSHVFH
jgi:hypothetical protein